MLSTKQKMLDTVLRRGNDATFAELFRENDDFRGRESLNLRDLNIVIWPKVSDDFIDAIIELLNDKSIEMIQASERTYMLDGEVVDLPIAKSDRKYKKPHWRPVTISLTRNGRALAESSR
jgi:hypothetical protein